jgi:trimethylamine--corrinoid protein Co-methyltransferase
MEGNYTARQTPQFRMFSESQLDEFHRASLEILRRTGVNVLEEEARELLKKAGAQVDGVRVRIPPHLVEWAVRTAPSQITLCDSRDGKPRVQLAGYKGYYGTGSDTVRVIDPYTGERRPAVKADVANVAKLCDCLPNIDFVMSMGIAHDVTASISDLHHFEAMVHNTRKPLVCTAWSLDNLKDIVEMAEVVAGGPDALRQNPFLVVYCEPISPLQIPPEPIQKLLYLAEKGLPAIWTPGQTGGATSPVTVAGALAQGNAEALIGIVLAQLKREGAPVVYGHSRLHMDMRAALCSYGAPEFMLGMIGCHELAHYYDLPVWSYGACSDAKTFDQQAGFVGALWTLVCALSGGNLMHDVGYLEAGLTSSLEYIVASDELIGMVKRLMGGVEVSEETLAVDVIDQVGPGGQFLTDDHTLRHFREDWVPQLFDRGTYDTWVAQGSKTLGQRANDRVREILETHVPEPLPEEVKAKLAATIERAERRASKGSA